MYIDDSDSMSGGDHLPEATRALARLGAHLGMAPTRIVKFGSSPRVMTPRSEVGMGEEVARAAAKEWNGSSGGTYMWKMIENDILQQYLPGAGRLRVFIITDGMDEMSPWAYRGLVLVGSLSKGRKDCQDLQVIGAMIILSSQSKDAISCCSQTALILLLIGGRIFMNDVPICWSLAPPLLLLLLLLLLLMCRP